MTYEGIVAWASVAAALTAMAAVIVGSRSARFSLGMDLLIKLDDRFQAPAMQRQRRTSALALLAGRPAESEDVLDFFEMIGMLVRRRTLDSHLVWHIFFHWINGYVSAASEHIATVRNSNPTIWQDLTYLRRKLVLIEKRERRCADSDIQLSMAAVRGFLEEESGLDPDGE
jgi:hypothetical protein